MNELPNKICKACGRRFAWRKKWEAEWEHVKFCSQRCRRQGISKIDQELEEALLSMSQARGAAKSLCPSEVARQVFGDDWKQQMERTRQAARRLAHADKLHILQGGKKVDPSDFKGPIRVRITR